MTFRIAQISDVHFGGENQAAVAAVAAYLAETKVDLVVLAGDHTVQGRPGEFAAARAWIETLPAPRVITPGNHDTPYNAIDRLISPFSRYERALAPTGLPYWAGPDAALVSINTARGIQPRANWSKGQISARQTREAIGLLAGRQAGAMAAVVCHHPLTEMLGGPMTGRVWGGEAAARAFIEAGVDLILTGHIHAPFAMPLGLGDNRTYAVGSGTLSVRERGVAASFNLIEATAETLSVLAVAWTGSHFEPWRSWAFPRRVL
ncbi:MAG: metallophosphoesterase [Caulobacteraceae bacterium]